MPKLTSPRMLAGGRVCCSHSEGLCPDCQKHHATVPDPYSLPVAPRAAASATPPDPYAAGLAKMRAMKETH